MAKSANMDKAGNLLVSLVNPRFSNFNKPRLLACIVAPTTAFLFLLMVIIMISNVQIVRSIVFSTGSEDDHVKFMQQGGRFRCVMAAQKLLPRQDGQGIRQEMCVPRDFMFNGPLATWAETELEGGAPTPLLRWCEGGMGWGNPEINPQRKYVPCDSSTTPPGMSCSDNGEMSHCSHAETFSITWWEEREIRTPVAEVIGAALGYTAYIEAGITAVVLLSLWSMGVIRLVVDHGSMVSAIGAAVTEEFQDKKKKKDAWEEPQKPKNIDV